MNLSDRDARWARVGSALVELERSTESVNVALRTHKHESIDQAVADQRRLTHELTNLIEADSALREGDVGDHIARRLRHIQLVREEQIKHLRAYRAAIGSRLRTIAKYKETPMSRKVPAGPILFEDIR